MCACMHLGQFLGFRVWVCATQSFSLVLPCFSFFPLECVMCVGTQWEDLQNCGERLQTVFAGALKSLFTRLWPQRPLGCTHGLLCSLEAFHTHPGQQTGRAEASTLGTVIEKFLCFFFVHLSPLPTTPPFYHKSFLILVVQIPLLGKQNTLLFLSFLISPSIISDCNCYEFYISKLFVTSLQSF